MLTIWATGLASTIETLKHLTGVEPTLENLETLTLNLYETGRQISAAKYLTAISVVQQLSTAEGTFQGYLKSKGPV